MSRSSKERDIGREVLEGIQQLKRGKVGRVVSFPPISKVREGVGLSQSEFATLLGVSVRTLQEWEQGRRIPSGPARMLLRIAHKNPKALLEIAV
jgi:putative transcriptional regulator